MREDFPAGALQRGLACDPEVRRSRVRSHRLRAVVGAVQTHHTKLLLICASRPNPHHKTTTAGTFHTVYFPKAVRHGQALCREPHCLLTLPGRAAEDRQERRVPATDRRPEFACSVLPTRLDPLFVVTLRLLCPTSPPEERCSRDRDVLDAQGAEEHATNHDTINSRSDNNGSRKRGVLGSTSCCELCHGVGSRHSFWTATTAPTVSSLRKMQVCAQCLIFFRVCDVSDIASSGDVNTQNHTWTSGLPSLVINIVFVAFLLMRCLPPPVSLFAYFGCPSMSQQVRLVFLILVPYHRSRCRVLLTRSHPRSIEELWFL